MLKIQCPKSDHPSEKMSAIDQTKHNNGKLIALQRIAVYVDSLLFWETLNRMH